MIEKLLERVPVGRGTRSKSVGDIWQGQPGSSVVQRIATMRWAPFHLAGTRLLFPFAPLFTALLTLFGAPPEAVGVARVTISEEIVMRVPVIRPHFAFPIRWKDTKGPRCIKGDNILATTLADDG